MIWIIGGTAETGTVINEVGDTKNIIITCATDSEKEFIDWDKLIVGRMNYYEMLDFVDINKINMIVDLSHPYAEEVSKNAKKAAADKRIKYIRYIRGGMADRGEGVYLNNLDECLEYLKTIKGTWFFTTGSKNIKDFEKIRGSNRFIYRVLPALESIEECKEHNVKMRDIVAVLGPFSTEFNKSMFMEYSADFVIMKDSGKEGGTIEKLQACRELQIMSVIIGRKNEEGIDDLGAVLNIIKDYGADLSPLSL